MFCGSLLRRLLRQSHPRRKRFSGNLNVHRKKLLMIRPGLTCHSVFRGTAIACSQRILKRRFEVLKLFCPVSNFIDLRLKKPQRNRSHRIDPSVQIHCGNQRFETVHQQGLFRSAACLLFAPPKMQVFAQVNLLRVLDKIRGAYQKPLDPGKLALSKSRNCPAKDIGDQKAEDRVAKELQLFVVRNTAGPFMRVRTVGEGLRQKGPVTEPVTKLEFEVIQRAHKKSGRIYSGFWTEASHADPKSKIQNRPCPYLLPIFAPASEINLSRPSSDLFFAW